MAQSVVVSVGRSIGQEGQLSDTAWYAFRRRVQEVVSREGVVVFVGWGTGYWEGTKEEAFTVIGSSLEPNLPQLSAALEHLRIEYQQKAIAVTVGDTTLIEAEV